MSTKLSTPEVATIQSKLRAAMNALDACGQDDLSQQVHTIFKEVARRAYPEPVEPTVREITGRRKVTGRIVSVTGPEESFS